MALSQKTVVSFPSEDEASKASAFLSEAPAFEGFPIVILEANGHWLLECYDDGALAAAGAANVLSDAGLKIESATVAAIPQVDWVVETQRGLRPVRAGRFTVHGSHDRAKVVSQCAIEIDAGRAFGTAHHGTTKGCLIAIDGLSHSCNRRSVLDLGTGSGVLAIAAAKALHRRVPIVAMDIDPVAIAVARNNCRKNGVSTRVSLFVGDGVRPTPAFRRAPFGLVIANILAKPLLTLAPRLRFLTESGGLLILSGLLSGQAREILARYRAVGFCKVRHADHEGWTTLTLKRIR
ncbi:MAG: 50S ribosomal protein L11 methyltransferase [Rhodomicrobium sp.]